MHIFILFLYSTNYCFILQILQISIKQLYKNTAPKSKTDSQTKSTTSSVFCTIASHYIFILNFAIRFYYWFTYMQEDRIKNYLHMIGMEDQFYATNYSPKSYKLQRGKTEKYSHQHLSDWNNRRQLSMQLCTSLPKLESLAKKKPQRVNSMDITDYQSSLLKDLYSRKKQQSMFMSPVVIKFNTNVSGNSLRRSQLLFHRILHNEADKKSQDPKKLRQMLRRIKPKQQQSLGVVSPPKTERCSGILRMLKKRQQIRIFKRRKQNPQALRAIKLQ